MSISISTFNTVLTLNRFQKQQKTKSKIRYYNPLLNEYAYIDIGRKLPRLIIHPKHDAIRSHLAALPGVNADKSRWHNSSNMGFFYKHINKGNTPIPYGIAFSFETKEALEKFVHCLCSTLSDDHCLCSTLSDDPFEDVARAGADLNTLPDTERTALIKSRIGQGIFREKLEKYWRGGCAVTECTLPAVLRASHIKPWRDSSNEERLDH